ncbi:Trk system potassium transporter TrkA [candidate division KSB1 bacterium]|nr:Trk system potassium transporter TrkA [candidate division KSB1 bacterium]
MRIVIIGAGEVGYHLAKQLSFENHDVSIVERDPERHTRVVESLDVHATFGTATSYSILEQAGIKDADLLVAATTNDEVNMLVAMMAKQYGVERTIARIKNMEFLHPHAPINAEKLGVDLFVHPESESAEATIRLLKQSAATDVVEFENGRISLIGVQIGQDCPVLFKKLMDLPNNDENLQVRVVAILRKDITRIPTGQDSFQPNDRIFLMTTKESAPGVLNVLGKANERMENVMILGGGQIGYLIAQELQKSHNVKLIESDADKSAKLAEGLSKSLVIRGDGRDLNLLAQEGIIDMDAFIAATGDDETNIITCLMARHLRVPRIISLTNKTDYMPILPTIGINAYISKQMITVSRILKFIRRGEILSVVSMPGVAAEAIELVAQPHSKITKKPLMKLNVPKNSILGAVLRDEKVFIPVGTSQIEPGDKVFVFALPSAVKEVEKMFS